MAGKGDSCYFTRDLSRGAYGGDVYCLQQHLKYKGLIGDEPSGYYGERTEVAAAKWQEGNGVTPAKGYWGWGSRQQYAAKQGLPSPAAQAEFEALQDNEAVRKTCIDICAEFGGAQDCQTRCVRTDAEKKHACKEACQVAFSAACDRAFPPTADGGTTNYKTCLQYMEQSCKDTCAQFSK